MWRKEEQMQRWSELSPEARNKLVAETIMEGELAPYSEDLKVSLAPLDMLVEAISIPSSSFMK